MFEIRLSDPTRINELREALVHGNYPAVQTSEDILLVTPLTADEAEARLELKFFLKAWLDRRPDVEARLVA